MNVLIVGGGGREHALAHKLRESSQVQRIFCAPGNAGTACVAENLSMDVGDHQALILAAKAHAVDLTVVGPEGPLCGGIVDRFQSAGLRIFGPSRDAARIEGDKGYAKKLMKHAHIPTAEARIFHHFAEAKAYVETRETGVVVKASGLAAGKGVFVCQDPAEALLVLERMMIRKEFGDAADFVVVEEVLKGQELSVHALIDDRTIYLLDSAQDHKAVGDGDSGPNTGGMGAYSPAPIATREVLRMVEREVLVPIVDALRGDGAPYRGVLYVGLILTAAGPKVLEFNCRFGDPEAEVLLTRLDTDLLEILNAVVDGRLEDIEIRWKPGPAICVVMTSSGYPGKFESGKVIHGLEEASQMPDVCVFHSGTKRIEHLTVSNGGRVLAVTARGSDLLEAQSRAYRAVERIRFDNAYYRRDIADKALR